MVIAAGRAYQDHVILRPDAKRLAVWRLSISVHRAVTRL